MLLGAGEGGVKLAQGFELCGAKVWGVVGSLERLVGSSVLV